MVSLSGPFRSTGIFQYIPVLEYGVFSVVCCLLLTMFVPTVGVFYIVDVEGNIQKYNLVIIVVGILTVRL